MKYHSPIHDFCFIGSDSLSDEDCMKCLEHRLSKIEDTPEIKGEFVIHIGTGLKFEWIEETVKGTFRQAKERYNEMRKMVFKNDTNLDGKEDGRYIVIRGNKKMIADIKTKGEDRKIWYSEYIENDIQANNSIDLTT